MVISRRRVWLAAAALSAWTLVTTAAAPAAAKDPPATATAEAALHHAPRMTARTGEDIVIGAVLDRPDRVARAVLVYSSVAGMGEAPFERSSNTSLPYVAVVPGKVVRPDLGYAIELETLGGERVPVFATRKELHRVTVVDAPDDAREAAHLVQLGGRRSVVAAMTEYAHFGTVGADVPVAGGPPVRRSVRDEFYRAEGSYTYRLLGTVSEFGIRAGAVRGRSLVPGESDPAKYDVGLNYGAPRLRLRLTDGVHAEGELLTSVTEVGFAMGGGGAVLLGDPYGAKLTLGLESIQVFGTRGYTRLDVVASRWLRLAPIVELTTMPHADRAGVRLLLDTGFELGLGFRLDVRAGYQARTFERGGPSLGAGLAYAF